MKRVLTIAFVAAWGLSPAVQATYRGSIVSSFDALFHVGQYVYAPLGLAWDGADIWCGYGGMPTHGGYVVKWATNGSLLTSFPLTDDFNFDAAYDTARDILYVTDYGYPFRVLAVDPSSGSILSSFDVPPSASWVQGLAFGGGYLYLGDSQSGYIFKTTTNGSVVQTLNPGINNYRGLAWDGDTIGGPYLFSCDARSDRTIYQINASTGSVLSSFAGPNFTGSNMGLTWDGVYLWTAQNHAPPVYTLYAFQFVAYEHAAVAPASLGKIKALFR